MHHSPLGLTTPSIFNENISFQEKNGVACMIKYMCCKYPVKVGQFSSKKIGLKQNGATCMEKTEFYKYSVKVGQFL